MDLASPIEATVTSSLVPGFLKAGISAVTMTTATFLAESVADGHGQAIALENVGDGLDGLDRVLVAVARQADDQAVADQLVVPRAGNHGDVLDARAAGKGRASESHHDRTRTSRSNVRRMILLNLRTD